ncbi:hypothetical protein GLOIN_2v948475 [Rhizophagus irregularis DAOM 181602=DAOM 197198]|nr:hypothetical protein GLOIN_2v948475 [Rhizophagus irregularis DAOM 181602=DAOM 197198]
MWVVWALFSLRLSLGLPSLFSLLELLLGPFSLRLSLGLPSLCLGLRFIRSPFRPFFFSSLFRFIFSPSRYSKLNSGQYD